MDSRKLYFGLVGLLVLLGIGLLGSMNEATAIFQKKSTTLVHLEAEQQAANASQAVLTKDKKDITTYADLNTIAKTVVPQDKNQAEAIQEIVDLAAESGISQLSSIAFPPSTLGGPHVQIGNNLTQVTPVAGIPGVYELQITISQSSSSAVSYNSFTTFLKLLEQNRRTAQVSSINIQPDPKTPNLVAFTLVVNEFIKP